MFLPPQTLTMLPEVALQPPWLEAALSRAAPDEALTLGGRSLSRQCETSGRPGDKCHASAQGMGGCEDRCDRKKVHAQCVIA
jgi:hypothetical protein